MPPRDAPRGGRLPDTGGIFEIRKKKYFFLKFCKFRKRRSKDHTATRQETLQEAAVCQIPIGFLKVFPTILPPNLPAVATTRPSRPDRRPPRLKDSPGLGGALTPSNHHIIVSSYHHSIILSSCQHLTIPSYGVRATKDALKCFLPRTYVTLCCD